VLALLMFRSTLNMFSIIGVVMLMGLVTKNAILLVDFAIRSRDAGMERTQALLHAAHVRLRPILMTTLAMIFGMVPLAFALSEGSEQRSPMGQAVIGGVIISTTWPHGRRAGSAAGPRTHRPPTPEWRNKMLVCTQGLTP
jgi:HAE1 family hydrophobic/amphiphilic exporter-1